MKIVLQRNLILLPILLSLVLCSCSPGYIRGGRPGLKPKPAGLLPTTPGPRTVLQSFAGQPRCAELIGGSEATGWYALMEKSLLRWDRRSGASGISSVSLQWDYELSNESAMHALLGNTYIAGGMRSPSAGRGPIRFGEFDAATGKLLGTYENGDSSSRWGAGTKTAAGGFLGCVYVDALPKTSIVLDVFYRKPPMAPIPGTKPPSTWWYERRTIPTTQSGLFDFLQVVQGPDGLVWIFIARDSAGTVSLVRYRPEADGLVFVDADAEFIPRGLGPLSIMGEAPRITAVTDRRGNRIMLAYQSSGDAVRDCGSALLVSHWSVVEVRPDKTFSLIAETQGWSPHIAYPMPLVVPRSDGIYYSLPFIHDDCTQTSDIGILKHGRFYRMDRLPYGSILSLSKDGWMLFLDRSDATNVATYLIKVRCRPELKIRDRKSELEVDTDEADLTGRDILEWSLDPAFKKAASYGTGYPPWRIPKTAGPQFFRVRPTYQAY